MVVVVVVVVVGVVAVDVDSVSVSMTERKKKILLGLHPTKSDHKGKTGRQTVKIRPLRETVIQVAPSAGQYDVLHLIAY